MRHTKGVKQYTVVAPALACLLALAQAGILIQVAWDKSDTADETRYVAAAASLWAHGEHRDLCEAPALPKRAFGLALSIAERSLSRTPLGWQGAAEALIAKKPAETLRRLFFTARLATIAVVVLAGFFVSAVASRFGRTAAVIAQALWCFSPTLLANGSLAALDAWSAAAMALVLWASTRLVERPTSTRTIVVGMACGAAAATKITTLLVVPLISCVLFWKVVHRPFSIASVRRWAHLTALLVVALLLAIWAIYGGSVGGVDVADPCPFSIEGAPRVAGWLPFPAWLEGVLFQLHHGQEGHASYLFGEVRTSGWWWFYLACLALKVPLGTQAMAIVGAAASWVESRRHGRSPLWIDTALLAYPVLLLAAMSLGRHQANIAFLLPALPFVCVWLGRAAPSASSAFGRVGRLAIFVLLALTVCESLRVHPHYLMFYNLWAGGPEGGPRYLIHREDWGQDKRLLASWQRERGIERLYYTPYGPNAEEWGVVFAPVPCEPTPGVYALHAVEVHRPRFMQRGCADWLTVEPPDQRLGYSIYIYFVDEERLRRLAEKQQHPAFWQSDEAK
ncbi:MAG: glycosyltransferase family 39 protein [Thermodesulfobacteriota bacterium]